MTISNHNPLLSFLIWQKRAPLLPTSIVNLCPSQINILLQIMAFKMDSDFQVTRNFSYYDKIVPGLFLS